MGDVMGHKFKSFFVGAILSATPGGAGAADLIEPPVYEVPEISGWYLRGDIGMSNQELHGGLYNVLFSSPDNFQFLDEGSFASGVTYRIGVGYQYNDLLRFDATAELRGKTDFSALDRYETTDDGDPTTWDGANDYRARKREWLFLANAYVDLGTWSGITPYVGAGAGAARITFSNFRDINVPNAGIAYAGDDTVWNFAWALHAGLGVEITDRLTLDLGYSYVHLGDGQTGDTIAFDGTNAINNPMVFEDITSHDLKFGLRYKIY